jgi:Tol biopolymer transport system component
MKKTPRRFKKQLYFPLLVTSLLLCSLTLLANMAVAGKGETEGGYIVTSLKRVSVGIGGEEGNGTSQLPAISADSRYIAFYSLADNLVVSDTNGFLGWDIFVYDMETDTIEMVSVSSAGEQGNGSSTSPDISADGSYVVFTSSATNLVMGDTNGVRDVFVHDRQSHKTRRVSVNSAGEQGNGSSSGFSKISADGRFVTFSSSAINLVPDDTNYDSDIFVHDLQTGMTERVSVSSQGDEGNWYSTSPAISGDGRFVTFGSRSNTFVPNDTNAAEDIFVHDRQTGQTTRVSVSSDGQEAEDNSSASEISYDGRYVAFLSYANNLVEVEGYPPKPQVYIHDRETGITTMVSVNSSGENGNDRSGVLAISPDGRYVTFGSQASNLVAGDTNGGSDIFVHDHILGITLRISITPSGIQGNDTIWGPAITDGGRTVAFWARADNLVDGDNNEEIDVFVSQWRLFQTFLPIFAR